MGINIGNTEKAGYFIGAERVIPDNLELHIDATDIDSYPGSGTAIYDTSGNSNDGVMVNGVTWSSDGYFTVDGSNDKITFSSIATLSDWSLCFWLKHTSTQGANYERIFGASSNRFEIAEDTSDKIRIYDGSWRTISAVTIPSGDWVNLVFTMRLAGPTLDIYKNGVNLSSTADGRTLSGYTFYLGSKVTSGEQWAGSIGSFMVYSAQLTSDQVLHNFNADRGRYGI